ncbi:MAG: AmmeMemoRadiSam system protein B [Candidatus Nanoarchaeia archaeon]
MSVIREPIAAGTHYPADFNNLQALLQECFTTERGPGALPISQRTKKLKAVVVPHAGYQLSGPAAAWAYKEIGEAKLPDVFVILGNHSRKTCLCNQDWKTPFGIVRGDMQLIKELQKEISVNNEAHASTHCIEVQLPFLQMVCKDKLEKLRIVPILIGDGDYKKNSAIIREALEKLNKKAVFIVPTSFTCYGRKFSYIPFSLEVEKNLKELDTRAASYIQKLDAEGFVNFVGFKSANFTGKNTIPLMIDLVRDDFPKASLLQYYTSGHVTDDFKNCVSYMALSLDLLEL